MRLPTLSSVGKTILIAGFCIVLVSAVILYAGFLMVDRQIDQMVHEKQRQTKITAMSIEEKFNGIIRMLQISSVGDEFTQPRSGELISAELKGVPQSAEPQLRKVAQAVLKQWSDFDNIAFTMSNGDTYLVEPYDLQAKLTSHNFAFRDWYMGVVRTNGPYLSEIFIAESTGRKTVKIAVPVTNEENNLVGIWGGILDLDFVALELDRLSLNKNMRILFFDHNGNIVADTLGMGFTTREKEVYYKHVVRSLTGQHGGAIDAIDDQKFLVTYGPVKVGSTFWGVLMIESYDAAFSSINENRTMLLFALALVVAIIVVTSAFRLRLLKETYSIPLQDTPVYTAKKNQVKDAEYKEKPDKEIIRLSSIHYLTMIVIFVAIVASVNMYMLFENQRIEYSMGLLSKPMQTGYVIQNLRGDTIDTWLSWNLVAGSKLTVNIKNSNAISLEQLDAVKESIISSEIIELDDSLLHKGPKGSVSLYYKGWQGALESISAKQTKLFVPNQIEIIESPSGEGHIIIEFTDLANGDGYSGYTKSLAEGNQILKSTIIVYDVDSLTAEQIATIVRHEFGHALGLAHSTAPEDLMAPVIQTNYPYISECALDALQSLYDGSQNSQIVCEK